jgi:hypothetical protein
MAAQTPARCALMSAPASFVPVAYGIDDVTLGFDMEGSGAIERLKGLPGTQITRVDVAVDADCNPADGKLLLDALDRLLLGSSDSTASDNAEVDKPFGRERALAGGPSLCVRSPGGESFLADHRVRSPVRCLVTASVRDLR